MARLERLTGIRAVAAAWVVTYHFRDDIVALLPPAVAAWPIMTRGDLGVDLFFILSGFVLSLNYLQSFQQLEKGPYIKFLVARLARVYPTHLATLLIVTAMFAWARFHRRAVHMGENFTVRHWIENVLLIHAWPGIGTGMSWNYPAWSISCEWLAYLVFPLACARLIAVRYPAWGIGLALGTYSLLAAVLWQSKSWPWWGLDSAARIVGEFAAGCLLYRIYQERSVRVWNPLYSVAFIVGALYGIDNEILLRTALVFLFPVLILGLAQYEQGILSGRVAVFWGEVSYSLYMVQAVCQFALSRTLPSARFVHAPVGMRVAVIVVYMILLLGSAVTLYFTVEAPSRVAVRKALTTRVSARVAAA